MPQEKPGSVSGLGALLLVKGTKDLDELWDTDADELLRGYGGNDRLFGVAGLHGTKKMPPANQLLVADFRRAGDRRQGSFNVGGFSWGTGISNDTSSKALLRYVTLAELELRLNECRIRSREDARKQYAYR